MLINKDNVGLIQSSPTSRTFGNRDIAILPFETMLSQEEQSPASGEQGKRAQGGTVVVRSISAFYGNTKHAGQADASEAGNAGAANAAGKPEAPSTDSVLEEFSKLAHMTPAQRIRANYLQAHHLTEEEFRALPPEQQAAINREIAEEIEREAIAAARKQEKAASL